MKLGIKEFGSENTFCHSQVEELYTVLFIFYYYERYIVIHSDSTWVGWSGTARCKVYINCIRI